MDSDGVVFAMVVVGLLLGGAAALVVTALLVARRMMLDRLLREWSVSREVGAGRWSWIGTACTTMALVALVTAFATMLGAADPSRLLSSPWAILMCTLLLGGFTVLAWSSSPRRAESDTRSGDDAGTAVGKSRDRDSTSARRAA